MEQPLSYIKYIKILWNKWYYLLASVVLSIICGYFFIYLTAPSYSASASIKLDEKKSELSELINIKNIYDRTSKSESEKLIIYSRNVLTKAIIALDYKTSYFSNEHYYLTDLYPQKPITIQVIKIPKGKTHNTLFKFEAINHEAYKLSYTFEHFERTSQHKFGKTITMNGFEFRIFAPKNDRKLPQTVYYFRFNEVNDLLTKINKSLKIDDNQNTNILSLTFTAANPYFARDILNSILQEYQKFDRSQRSVSIKQTSLYIDTLLQNMSLVLKKSAIDIQQFKASNQMLNVSTNAESLTNRLTSLETEKHNLTIQNLFTTALRKVLERNHNLNTPNFDLQGVEDQQLIMLLNKFNLLIDKKTESLKIYQPESAFMIDLDEQINVIKLAVSTNIKSQDLKNKELLAFLNKQIQEIKLSIESTPGKEGDYISLQSDFNINQKVYNYLSEKKLEAHISTAAVTSGAQVIDDAVLSTTPVYPVEASIYKDFLLAGLIMGTLSIFIVRNLNPFLYDVETIEELTKMPIIGSIRKHTGSSDQHIILSIDNPRSLFSESVRALRANLSFMVTGNNGKVICITSEIAGEGKSFTSLNLAGTLCLIDKKVIVVSTDLRKSQLHKTFQTSNISGLSSYLSGQEFIENLCLETRFTNLDFIPAGPVPPNPSELIQSDKMLALVNYLQQRYDFIILDSAPVGLVSDSIPLMRMADINFFVLRYGFSRRLAATLPEKLSKEFNLSNMSIVLNAFNSSPVHKSYYSLSSNEKSYEHYASVNENKF
ncbi:tyrosine-protein kinase Etk/Wzc [Pedobacter sp. CG_S7]|uniref:GumC family protein n=1 Tax=Pedobacter sp. CG_S7 TaxID=3143930 RepID=UPI0033940D8E